MSSVIIRTDDGDEFEAEAESVRYVARWSRDWLAIIDAREGIPVLVSMEHVVSVEGMQ